MPYKDIENRRKAIRNHYKNNKAYYQKKSNKWKIDNTEKVRASRIRYQEKIKLKKLLDIIIDLKKENKEYQKEVNKFISDMRKIIFESIGIEDQKSIKKCSKIDQNRSTALSWRVLGHLGPKMASRTPKTSKIDFWAPL